ncbi:MAG: F-box protein [Parachlamydiales bacterium]|nr:F-box protein [Parachlamydiales bacterium]
MTTPISTLSSYDYISSFSPEIILEIAQHSNATDLFTATLVSKGWKQVFETCYIWEEFLNDMPLFCKRDQLVESAFQAFVREKKMRLSVIKKAPFVANLGNNYYRALDACKDGFVVQNKHSGVLFVEHSLNIKKYQLSKKRNPSYFPL